MRKHVQDWNEKKEACVTSDCMRPQSRLPIEHYCGHGKVQKEKKKTRTHNYYTHTITKIITILANYVSSSDTTLYIVSP